MRRTIAAILAATAIMLAPSCKKTPADVDRPTPHTLIFYFTGTQLAYYFDRNMTAAAAAIERGAKGDCRVICIYQGSDRKRAEAIELTYRDGECTREVIAKYELPSVTTGSDMSHFIRETMNAAPAESYGLVMAGHATAWLPADTYGTTPAALRSVSSPYWRKVPGDVVTRYFGEYYSAGAANIFDIETISDALTATGVKFDYILFDACFMANVESAYALRRNADRIIGAPCEVLGSGFPYDEVLPHLLGRGGRADIDAVCRAFNEYYAERYGYSGSVAAIECSQLDALAAAMKKIHVSAARPYDPDALQTYEGQSRHIFFDLGDYAKKACGDSALKEEFRAALERCVPVKYTLPSFWSNYGTAGSYPVKTYSGISTSEPAEVYRDEYMQTEWYRATH